VNFEIYCDECRPELFTSSVKSPPFLSIGGIWIPASERDNIKDIVKRLRKKHNVWGEFKWSKISAKSLPFYFSLIDYFFSNENMRFRTILIDSRKVDLFLFHDEDAELGFYKFYYQLIHNWIYDFNEYEIYTDIKTNRLPDRLAVLKNVLINSNLSSKIRSIQALPSKEVILIQLADLLTGAVNAKFNQSVTSQSKLAIIERIEYRLKKEIIPTSKSEEKFNVFKIRLQGGW